MNISTSPKTLFSSVLRLFAVFLLLPLCARGQLCAPAPAGLVNWWRGEGNANDSADGIHGTLQNGATFTAGKVGQAFSFDGVNDSVSFGNTIGNFGTNDFTIEYWIKTSSTRIEAVLGKWGNCGLSSFFAMRLTSGKLSMEMAQDAGGNNFNSRLSNQSINDGVFHHIALVRQTTSIKMYIDGVADFTNSTAGITGLNNTAELLAGSGPCIGVDGTANFTGQLDDISIYNRALNLSEILSIYTAGSAGKCLTPTPVSVLTNGSFELPPQSPGSGQDLPSGSTLFTGWTVGSIVGMGWQNGASSGVNPVDGDQQITFNGGNAAPGAYIFQTFSTIVGQTYTVSFYVGRAGGGGGTMSLLAEVTSSTAALLGSLNAIAPSSSGYGSIQTFSFSATTATSTLRFTDTSSATDAVDVLLDNVSVVPASQCVAPPSGLVSWWPFDGNPNDIVGSNVVTLSGSPAYAAGVVGQALMLDGADEARVTASPNLNVGAANGFTVETWINPVNVTSQQPLADWNNRGELSGVHFWISVSGFGNGGPGSLYANLVDVNGTSHQITSNPALIGTNAWQHVAVTYDKVSGITTLYRNGVVIAQQNLGTFIPQTTYDLFLGQRINEPFSQTRFFGLMDEVGLFSRALSAGEIQSIYAAGSAGKCLSPPPPPTIGTFTNGSFELPMLVSGSSVDMPAGSTNIIGWKVGNTGLVSWRNGPAFGVAPIDGSQEIAFNGSDTPPGGAISQTFSTGIGQTYEVRFNVGRQASGSGSMSLLASVTSSTDAMLGSLNASAPSSPGFGPSQAFTFTATTAASTLTFTDTSSATVAVDVLLDNVTVTPVSNCATVPSGLVSWWQGESNASDSSGINNGTLVGNAAFTEGKVGQAFRFDGNGDAVFLGNPAALHLQNFTIDAWIKRGSTTQASLNAGGGLLVAYGGGGYAFGFLDDGRTFLTQVGVSQVTSTYQITDTNFHHVAVTKTGSTVVFYVDGVAYPASSFDSVFSFGSQVAIGARGDNFANSFLGVIDELDIFNRALTGAEILAIYNNGATGKCGIAPSIIAQPSSQARNVGGNAVFTVVATGTSPLSYQWRFNTTNIAGAVNPSLVLANLQPADAGAYSVVVSNAVNSLTSSNAILTVNPALPCASTPSGLVGWWRAQENALDAGGGNNGTLVGNTAYAAGQVGQAFSFDGNSDAVRVGNPANLQLQNFTIEAWIKRASATQASLDPSGGEIFGYGAGGYIFGVLDDGHLILSAVQVSQVSSSVQITDTSFHHVAVTKTGGSVVFYVDGIAYPAPSYDPGFSFTSQAAIGARGDNSGNSFLGLIDEVAVFNRALAASEIQSIYNAGSSGKCGTAPFITSQPTNQVATVGANVTFTVVADGTRPLSYQWRINGTNIVAATNTSLTLTSVQLDDAGGYDVVVSNEANTLTSSNATLTVNLPICVAAPSNLVSWWQGEGNALDAKGTNNGALVGNVSYTVGRVGQAFSFDGNGDAVHVGNPTNLQFQNLTIEAWIKRGSTTQASLNAGGGLIFAYGGGGYALGFLDDGHLFLTRIGVSQTTSTIQVTDTNFHHVAVTRTNSTVVFYVDGIAYPAANLASVFTFTSQAAIGARGDNSGNCFLGVIDEVTVYNRALSAAEMQSIYNAGGLGKCDLPPVILTSSQSQTVRAGTNVTFNVVATGTSPLSYQWQLNTTNIVGATNSALALTNVQAGASGTYTVVVGNSINAITSSPVSLKVIYVLAFGNGQPLTNSQHSFVDSVTVQLQTVLTNGTLFYTLDGSTPSFGSPQYVGPFAVTNSSFLRVITYSADFFQSYEADAIALIIIPSYTITAATPGGGTISVNPTNSPYASNTVVAVTAAPASGWTFITWQGDASGTNPVVNLTMDGNKSVQAIFGTTLGTTVAGNGAITLLPSAALYPFGTVVRLHAIPQTGNYFALWGNAASGSSNPLDFTISSANPTVSSLFGALSPGQFALTVIPNGAGQVTISPQTNRYSSGQNVTVTAIPDAGQQFIDWSGDASGTNNPLLVSMTGSKVITANFTQPDLLEAGPQRLNGEGFHLTLTGEFGSQYRVDGSTNLLDWTELFKVMTFGPVPFVDASATNTPLRFYRAVELP